MIAAAINVNPKWFLAWAGGYVREPGQSRALSLPTRRPLSLPQPSSSKTGFMTDEHTLALRQADQARSDFAAIESELDFI
jgi:hypothetical protein